MAKTDLLTDKQKRHQIRNKQKRDKKLMRNTDSNNDNLAQDRTDLIPKNDELSLKQPSPLKQYPTTATDTTVILSGLEPAERIAPIVLDRPDKSGYWWHKDRFGDWSMFETDNDGAWDIEQGYPYSFDDLDKGNWIYIPVPEGI